MIIRSRSDQWTSIPTPALRDNDLSYRARGILAYILSMPTHWETNSITLAARGPEGRDAIRTALQELRQHGYIVTTRTQDDAGQWRTTHTVYDKPVPVEKRVEALVESVQPKTENQASVSQAINESLLKSKKNKRAMGQTVHMCTTCVGSGVIADNYNHIFRCTDCGGDGIGTVK
jgi:hypothetical protein